MCVCVCVCVLFTGLDGSTKTVNNVFIFFINLIIKLRNRIKLRNQEDDIHVIFKSQSSSV